MRAWQEWNPSNASDVTDACGRALRVWHEASPWSATWSLTGTTAELDGAVLRVDRTSLRFLVHGVDFAHDNPRKDGNHPHANKTKIKAPKTARPAINREVGRCPERSLRRGTGSPLSVNVNVS